VAAVETRSAVAPAKVDPPAPVNAPAAPVVAANLPALPDPGTMDAVGDDPAKTLGNAGGIAAASPRGPARAATGPRAPSATVADVDSVAGAESASAGAGGERARLQEETRLVRDAHAALARGDAGRALALLDEHARRFPSGMLAEERAAERVFALCRLGRKADAGAEARAFARNFAGSPLARRVESACEGRGP
jgi:hypothetical protein